MFHSYPLRRGNMHNTHVQIPNQAFSHPHTSHVQTFCLLLCLAISYPSFTTQVPQLLLGTVFPVWHTLLGASQMPGVPLCAGWAFAAPQPSPGPGTWKSRNEHVAQPSLLCGRRTGFGVRHPASCGTWASYLADICLYFLFNSMNSHAHLSEDRCEERTR